MITPDIKREICGYLELKDLKNLFYLNREWSKLANDNRLWKSKLKQDFDINHDLNDSKIVYKQKVEIERNLKHEAETILADADVFHMIPYCYEYGYERFIGKNMIEIDATTDISFIKKSKDINRYLVIKIIQHLYAFNHLNPTINTYIVLFDNKFSYTYRVKIGNPVVLKCVNITMFKYFVNDKYQHQQKLRTLNEPNQNSYNKYIYMAIGLTVILLSIPLSKLYMFMSNDKNK